MCLITAPMTTSCRRLLIDAPSSPGPSARRRRPREKLRRSQPRLPPAAPCASATRTLADALRHVDFARSCACRPHHQTLLPSVLELPVRPPVDTVISCATQLCSDARLCSSCMMRDEASMRRG
jgi:hypothetical protein